LVLVNYDGVVKSPISFVAGFQQRPPTYRMYSRDSVKNATSRRLRYLYIELFDLAILSFE